MTNSYLGLITSQGLELLVAESGQIAPFLSRCASLEPQGQIACCWAVLDEGSLLAIWEEMSALRYAQALRLLNSHALHLGTQLPN